MRKNLECGRHQFEYILLDGLGLFAQSLQGWLCFYALFQQHIQADNFTEGGFAFFVIYVFLTSTMSEFWDRRGFRKVSNFGMTRCKPSSE